MFTNNENHFSHLSAPLYRFFLVGFVKLVTLKSENFLFTVLLERVGAKV